jgi:hypothetical protein
MHDSVIVDMASLHVMPVSSYNFIDVMTVNSAELYVVLARSSVYYIV